MTDIAPIIINGLICAAVLLYVLAPALRQKGNKAAFVQAALIAVLALGLFLWASTPITTFI